jgi:hypothetical protein
MRNISGTAPRLLLSRTALILPLSLLLIIYSLPATAQTRASSRAVRIRFAPGAFSAQVRGQMVKGRVGVFYVVKAKEGDHMIVNVISTTSGFETAGEIIAPSGEEDGQHGGVVFNRQLTETGDYKIRVTQNLMAGERSSGSFILEVVITPSYVREGERR